MGAIKILEDMLKVVRTHPEYWGDPRTCTEEEVRRDAGYSAFLTVDVGWKLMEVIKILKNIRNQY